MNKSLRRLQNTITNQNIVIRQCFERIARIESTRELRIIIKILFTNPPPIIETNKISKITDKHFLLDLESKYDLFIEKNQQLLLLHDVIEDILEIRDAILLQIGRLNRIEKKMCQ